MKKGRTRLQYDVFISHASEDKESFVEPLAKALEEAGLKVWYDRFVLKLGDDIAEKIDQGLANSRYGVVVLSKTFLAKKKWTQAELNALVNRQASGGKKVILPIWHNITPEEVANYSPILAGKVAVRSQDGLGVVVAQILDVCSDDKSTEAISVFQRGTELGLRGKCLEIIRQDNLIEWRKLVAQLTQPIPDRLKEWKKIGGPAGHKGGQDWEQAVIEATQICIPGFVPIFAAIEAGRNDFWQESLGILRRLAILENEMGGGATWALHIGGHMLYVAGTLGMAIAANLKMPHFIDQWMYLRMPEREGAGEQSWFQTYFANHLPEGISFDINEPFRLLMVISKSEHMTGFFASTDCLINNLLLSNLLSSLIELRICSQDQKCLDAIMNKPENHFFDVWPVWFVMESQKFKILTLECFGDSQSVIKFVFPSGLVTPDKFWPLWKRWRQLCLNRWWSSTSRHDLLFRGRWLFLPGEPAD